LRFSRSALEKGAFELMRSTMQTHYSPAQGCRKSRLGKAIPIAPEARSCNPRNREKHWHENGFLAMLLPVS
jgi:hypothetical protein